MSKFNSALFVLITLIGVFASGVAEAKDRTRLSLELSGDRQLAVDQPGTVKVEMVSRGAYGRSDVVFSSDGEWYHDLDPRRPVVVLVRASNLLDRPRLTCSDVKMTTDLPDEGDLHRFEVKLKPNEAKVWCDLQIKVDKTKVPDANGPPDPTLELDREPFDESEFYEDSVEDSDPTPRPASTPNPPPPTQTEVSNEPPVVEGDGEELSCIPSDEWEYGDITAFQFDPHNDCSEAGFGKVQYTDDVWEYENRCGGKWIVRCTYSTEPESRKACPYDKQRELAASVRVPIGEKIFADKGWPVHDRTRFQIGPATGLHAECKAEWKEVDAEERLVRIVDGEPTSDTGRKLVEQAIKDQKINPEDLSEKGGSGLLALMVDPVYGVVESAGMTYDGKSGEDGEDGDDGAGSCCYFLTRFSVSGRRFRYGGAGEVGVGLRIDGISFEVHGGVGSRELMTGETTFERGVFVTAGTEVGYFFEKSHFLLAGLVGIESQMGDKSIGTLDTYYIQFKAGLVFGGVFNPDAKVQFGLDGHAWMTYGSDEVFAVKLSDEKIFNRAPWGGGVGLYFGIRTPFVKVLLGVGFDLGWSTPRE